MNLTRVNRGNFPHKLNESGRILATDDMRRMRPIILRSMSSKLLPCVSGTLNMTKNRPTVQIVAKIPNTPCEPNTSEMIQFDGNTKH